MVLLGIRSTDKDDLCCTPAELVYGTTLQLPGDFFQHPKLDDAVNDPLSHVDRLRSSMQQISAPCTRHHKTHVAKTHVPDALAICTHVFIRHDAIKRSLQPPYDGPFQVIKRTPKHYTVTFNGRHQTVSIDRLKPAVIDDAELTQLSCFPLSTAPIIYIKLIFVN